MKHVIEGFSILFILMLNLVVCVSVLGAGAKVAEAKEYKAAVVAEIENSNFNPNVIKNCIVEAKKVGYALEIDTNKITDDSSHQMAEIRLMYQYEIPFLGIFEQRTTRGIAR